MVQTAELITTSYIYDSLPYVGMSHRTDPLTLDEALHLFRRTSFGASNARIQDAVGRPAFQVVDEIVDEVFTLPFPYVPVWSDRYDYPFPIRQYQKRETKYGIVRNMFEHGLREKMTLFWYDHFGSNISVHERPSFTYRALDLYRRKGMGNFFELLTDVGIGADMLRFLDGYLSHKDEPNENYSRELLELFTMSPKDLDGNPNYTEQDIVEISRALTGWRIDFEDIAPFFLPTAWADGDKEILTVEGNHDYFDVMGILKSQRGYQIAQYICLKIYRLFIYEGPNRAIINSLTNSFVNSDYDIGVVVRKILRSRHFFQEAARGVKVKDPLEMFVIAAKEAEYEIRDFWVEGNYRRIVESAEATGYNILEPPDVSGFPGHRNWLSTTTLPKRWSLLQKMVNGEFYDIRPQNLKEWARNICEESTQPPVIVAKIVRRIFSRPLSPQIMTDLENAFKGNIPDEEFENGNWTWDYVDADAQVLDLLSESYKYPEYHLS